MTKKKIKPIVIVSNWKAGSTLLQYILAREPKICNIFPNPKIEEDTNQSDYDGSIFWGKNNCDMMTREHGNCITKSHYEEKVDRDGILNQLDDMCDKEYGLIKRPQFVLSIPFVRWLLPEAKIIGITRDTEAVVYSYLRSNTAWRPNNHGIMLGLKPPGWYKFMRKSVIEYGTT